jgi:pimeloyl-ACP methyl ester carboxylesterase
LSSPPAARAFYLQGLSEPVFALFHAARAAKRDTAVLICPPFGWEDVCSYRSRREWADQLASAGYPTLRIDLPSTGDSGGSPDDPQRLAAWVQSVSVATQWLGANAAERVAAIGIGLGGLAICAAVAEGAPIDEIVLWAVPSRGKTFVRELRVFGRMESAKFARRGEPEPPALPDGSVGAGGFVLSAETGRALEGLDLTALELPKDRLRRALLLERDGIGVDKRLYEHLQSNGVSVQIAPGPGFGAMIAEPQEARPPCEVFATVETWLGEARPAGASCGEAERPTASPVAQNGHVDAQAGNGSAPSGVIHAEDTAELTIEGVHVRETPVHIEQPFGRLFGVLTEPAEGSKQELGAILLNAGAIRRIGPNRMWVDMARRWAARGVSSLRLDLEGLGDADGDASRFADVAELYVPELVAQVRSAVDVLEARDAARSFALAGLCSGAYWSFHGALEDERVVAAFMLNPRTLFWDATLENVRYIRRGLLRPSSWRMVLQGDVRLSRVGRVARYAPQSLFRHAIARWRSHGERDEFDIALDRLSSSGKHLVFVFSENEPLYEELERQGRLGDRWPNLALELLPGRDHTLRPAYSQRGAHDALDRALEHELDRVKA